MKHSPQKKRTMSGRSFLPGIFGIYRHSFPLYIVCLLAFLFLLPSCGAKDRIITASDPSIPTAAVEAMCQIQKELPCGQLYTSSAPEGEDGYISETLIAAFLGDGTTPPWQANEILSCAFYLSYTSPMTLGAFRCQTHRAAEDLALLCQERIRLYATYWTDNTSEDCIGGAKVTVHGRDVLLAICPDGRATVRRGADMLRRG